MNNDRDREIRTVKFSVLEKAYGFIVLDYPASDVFFRAAQLRHAGIDALYPAFLTG